MFANCAMSELATSVCEEGAGVGVGLLSFVCVPLLEDFPDDAVDLYAGGKSLDGVKGRGIL